MPWGFMGFLAFAFVGMIMGNRILEGAFISSSDVGYLNNITIFRGMEVFGLFTIPVPNVEFLSGMFHLVKFDYSYFGGNASFLMYFMYSLTFVLGCICFALIFGILVNFFGSRTR
jgi:uncharacterized membrane protein YjjB (DUF3815 family)